MLVVLARPTSWVNCDGKAETYFVALDDTGHVINSGYQTCAEYDTDPQAAKVINSSESLSNNGNRPLRRFFWPEFLIIFANYLPEM